MSLSRILLGIIAAATSVVWLSGCAIAELKSDVKATEVRIDTKQATLHAEQQNQTALAAQRDQLLGDLRNRELTAAQLKARLESMRALNDSAPVSTSAARQRRDERARRLAEMANQARMLEQDPGPSAQEKAKRAEALKEKTRKALEALLLS